MEAHGVTSCSGQTRVSLSLSEARRHRSGVARVVYMAQDRVTQTHSPIQLGRLIDHRCWSRRVLHPAPEKLLDKFGPLVVARSNSQQRWSQQLRHGVPQLKRLATRTMKDQQDLQRDGIEVLLHFTSHNSSKDLFRVTRHEQPPTVYCLSSCHRSCQHELPTS